MSRPLNFQFVEDLDQIATASEGVVEVLAGITNKRQLMQAFAQSVPLPEYFGGNWDALDECFRDRLLDEARRPLCLLHRDLPLVQDEHDCRDYLALLSDTLAWAKATSACEFKVIFPTTAASAIEHLVGRNDRS